MDPATLLTLVLASAPAAAVRMRPPDPSDGSVAVWTSEQRQLDCPDHAAVALLTCVVFLLVQALLGALVHCCSTPPPRVAAPCMVCGQRPWEKVGPVPLADVVAPLSTEDLTETQKLLNEAQRQAKGIVTTPAIYSIDTILKDRVTKSGTRQYLVKWSNSKCTTWLSANEIQGDGIKIYLKKKQQRSRVGTPSKATPVKAERRTATKHATDEDDEVDDEDDDDEEDEEDEYDEDEDEGVYEMDAIKALFRHKETGVLLARVTWKPCIDPETGEAWDVNKTTVQAWTDCPKLCRDEYEARIAKAVAKSPGKPKRT